jgi:hypothetical protein
MQPQLTTSFSSVVKGYVHQIKTDKVTRKVCMTAIALNIGLVIIPLIVYGVGLWWVMDSFLHQDHNHTIGPDGRIIITYFGRQEFKRKWVVIKYKVNKIVKGK